MRTFSLTSIAFALVPSIAFGAPLSAPVNVTIDSPAVVQQLPSISMTSHSTFIVFDDDTTRANAIRFAALVAMADGQLAAKELTVLEECGSHFKWDAEKVRGLVTDAAATVRGAP